MDKGLPESQRQSSRRASTSRSPASEARGANNAAELEAYLRHAQQTRSNMSPGPAGNWHGGGPQTSQQHPSGGMPPPSFAEFIWATDASLPPDDFLRAPPGGGSRHLGSTSGVPPYPGQQMPFMTGGGFIPSQYSAAGHSMNAIPGSADDAGDEEELEVTEDKRRRNTAASARFRIKKKQKMQNLERNVSDLTGRADELEREATDLRKENGWLREIVMLKGRRHYEQMQRDAGQTQASGSRRSADDDSDDESDGQGQGSSGQSSQNPKGKR